MIIAGQLLLVENDRCRVQPGWVRVAEERIAEIVVGEIPRNADFGGESFLISPGFIDTHLHLPQFESIGAHGRPLLKWLEDVIFPAEMRWNDTAYARAMTDRAITQLLGAGTTGFAAYATSHHAAAMAALQQADYRGVRALIGQTLMDREAPQVLLRDPRQLIQEAATTLEAFPPGRRVAAAVTPRFAVSCSGPLLEQSGQLAQERASFLQTHLAESPAECAWVEQAFGARYTDVYRECGLLSHRTLLGHAIHLDAAEMVSLSECGAVVSHCPTANSFLRSGTMRRDELRRCGVRLALGSDIGAGYERSMVRVGRAMIEAAANLGGEFPTASQAFYQITAGNADALQWNDGGRLATGNVADLVAIEPDIRWLAGDVDPLARLMFAWDDRWVKHVWLRGELAPA